MRQGLGYLVWALFVGLVWAGGSAAGEQDAEVALEFTTARALSEEGAIPAALDAWQRLLEMAPEEPYARVEFARFLLRIGRTDEAIEQATVARRLAPGNPDVLRAFADVHLDGARGSAEHLETARGALETLVEVDPQDIAALFDLGRAYYEQGRWAEAAVWLERAARHQPGNRMLQSYRIDSLLQSQQNDLAESVLRDLLSQDGSFLRGRLQLAALQSERGDHVAAGRTLRSAPEDQLEERELRWQLAGQLYRLGELDEGIKLLNSLLVEEPAAFRERMLKGMMLSALGRDAGAAEVYEGLHEDRPLNLDIVSELVKIGERRGDHEGAVALLREVEQLLIEEDSNRRLLQVRFELLSLLWRSQAWEELIREARPLAADPQSPLHVQGLFYLVDALHGSGRSGRALEVLEASAGGPIASYRLFSKRSEILADLGRDVEAKAFLDEVTSSDELPAMMAASEVLHRQQRYDEAASVLQRALEQAEDSSQVLYWLGAAFERSGDRERATTTFRRLLELDPQYAPALNYLGYMWAERGENLGQALSFVSRALAREPDNGAYVDSLGWVHFQLGEYDRARDLLERAARLVPDDAVISEHLGDTYARLGFSLKAQESYRRAIQLEGENKEVVQQKLDRLLISR